MLLRRDEVEEVLMVHVREAVDLTFVGPGVAILYREHLDSHNVIETGGLPDSTEATPGFDLQELDGR